MASTRNTQESSTQNSTKYMRQNHFFWVLSSAASAKIILGIKFLLTARTLGPENFGLVALVITVLTIAEGLSDTGLNAAIVQRKTHPSAALASVFWSIQLTRGILLTSILALAATPISTLAPHPLTNVLIITAAALPTFKGLINPGYTYLIRYQKHRQHATCEISTQVIDIAITLTLLSSYLNMYAVIAGSLGAEAMRAVYSWTLFREDVKFTMSWKRAVPLLRYSKWIWASSTLTVAINQFDKLVVAKLLGVADFGFYQASSRIAQLTIADPFSAYSQYLFPKFSRAFHQNRSSSHELYLNSLRRTLIGGLLIAVPVILGSRSILVYALGNNWGAGAKILQLQCATMLFGALISVNVSYLKANSNTRAITASTVFQALVLVPSALYGVATFGPIGAATSALLSMAACWALMTFWCFRKSKMNNKQHTFPALK